MCNSPTRQQMLKPSLYQSECPLMLFTYSPLSTDAARVPETNNSNKEQ